MQGLRYSLRDPMGYRIPEAIDLLLGSVDSCTYRKILFKEPKSGREEEVLSSSRHGDPYLGKKYL